MPHFCLIIVTKLWKIGRIIWDIRERAILVNQGWNTLIVSYYKIIQMHLIMIKFIVGKEVGIKYEWYIKRTNKKYYI